MADTRTEEQKEVSREAQLGKLGVNKPGKSLDEIAAMMEANRRTMQGDEPKKRPVQARTATKPNEVEEVEEDEEVTEEIESDELEDEEDVESTEEAPDTEEDLYEELDLSDDDLIELEGFDEPVSFKTLKDVYNADKTVVEKVKQAEESYTKAFTTAQTAVTQAEEMQNAMKTLVTGLEQSLMQPLVSKPDAGLKESNPTQYIRHMEAYNQDQERINHTKSQLLEALDKHASITKETKQKQRETEMARLMQKLEPLRTESTRKQASQDILKAAEHYGFSPDEVNNSADHRMFLMAYDAMQYRKLKGLSAEEKEERVTKIKRQVTSQPRIMRSKGTSAAQLSSAQKRVKVLKAKAAKSGRAEDVADFMAASRSARA